MQPVFRQRIGKHVPAVINTHTTIELLLETVFSAQFVQSSYKEDNWGNAISCQLAVVSWELSSAREAVKIEPERGKLKNLYC
jgi:hypothetical protein